MEIIINKFGDVLTSRQAGKEAYAAFLPTLKSLASDEEIIINFDAINSFSPSWADEFITPLQIDYSTRVFIKSSDNPSVQLTLATLEKVNGYKFQVSQ